MRGRVTRREAIATGIAAAGAGLGLRTRAEAAQPRMTLCLNSSTIRPASLVDKVRVAAAAGYDGIELWIHELEEYAAGGGSLTDLGMTISDLGLFVPNIIGLWDCMPAEDEAWPASLEVQKRRMELAVQVGAQHIAAIPTPDRPGIDVLWAARRYRELLEVSLEIGLTAAVEFVGFFRGIHTLGQATAIGIEANHPRACMVADTFHLYRGGSMFQGINVLQGAFIAVCHFNDAPASPPQFEQGDSDRVYPGDGILPLVQFVRDLQRIGFTGPLSLELFRNELWQRDPLDVAREGIDRMIAVVEAAGG